MPSWQKAFEKPLKEVDMAIHMPFTLALAVYLLLSLGSALFKRR